MIATRATGWGSTKDAIAPRRLLPLLLLLLPGATVQADDVEEGKKSGLITAVKLYPAGATTNSHGGVRDFNKAMPVLERVVIHGLTARCRPP